MCPTETTSLHVDDILHLIQVISRHGAGYNFHHNQLIDSHLVDVTHLLVEFVHPVHCTHQVDVTCLVDDVTHRDDIVHLVLFTHQVNVAHLVDVAHRIDITHQADVALTVKSTFLAIIIPRLFV